MTAEWVPVWTLTTFILLLIGILVCLVGLIGIVCVFEEKKYSLLLPAGLLSAAAIIGVLCVTNISHTNAATNADTFRTQLQTTYGAQLRNTDIDNGSRIGARQSIANVMVTLPTGEAQTCVVYTGATPVDLVASCNGEEPARQTRHL